MLLNLQINPHTLNSKYSLSKDHRVFSVLSSSAFDAGTYKCVASGTSGTASKAYIVTVEGSQWEIQNHTLRLYIIFSTIGLL